MIFSSQDFRDAIRALRRAPRFTLLCAAVLGVGIGLSTTMFTALHAVLLRPLPVADQDRVVAAWGVHEQRALSHMPFSVREWREFAAQSRTLDGVAAVDYNPAWPWVMRDGERAFPVVRGLVSGGFFQTLGATAALGRLLTPEDDRVGAEPVAVLSFGFWQRQYGGDASVLGRRVTMHASGVTHTIVGVAPQGLDYPAGTEMWMPIVPATTYAPADTSLALVDVVGRLRPGASVHTARDEVTAFLRRPDRPETMRQARGEVRTLPELIVGDVRGELAVLGTAVGLLLLVACSNVAGLLLMRGTRQGREIALRMAMGATAGRIVRRQAAEGFVLALLGCAAGAAIAWSTLGGVRHFAPAQFPRLDQIHPDAGALAVAAVIALISAILFATGPALVAARTDASSLLRSGAQSLSAGRRLGRLRGGLVIGQVAASVVVLSAAALVTRSFRELQRVELGFTKDEVMVVELGWDFTRVNSAERSLAIYDELLPRLRAAPGVVDASATLLTPFSGTGGYDVIYLAADRAPAEQQDNSWLNTEVVSPSYRDVFRLPLIRGRFLTPADREGAPNAVVLSEGAARALWPGVDALGREVMLQSARGAAAAQRWTVVGIVADTRYREYRRARPTVYFPHRQPPFPLAVTMLAIRTTGDPLRFLPQLRATLSDVTPDVVVGKAATMNSFLDAPLAQPRFGALVLVTFAGSALLIVGAGLYATLAFAVRMRGRELAIRAAVGATPAALRGVVLRSSALLVGCGVLAGLAASFLSTRALRSMLYGVAPGDPLAIAAGVLVLVLVAAVATLVPARWASRTTAGELLRSE